MDDKTFLEHYGIPGMHWGRRGARSIMLTPERQYKKDVQNLEKLNKGGHLSKGLTKKRQEALDKRDRDFLENKIKSFKKHPEVDTRSEDYKEKRRIQRKRIDEMSNEELKKVNQRLQLEKQYKELNRQDVYAGQKFVTDLLENAVRQTVSIYLARYLTKGAEAAFKTIGL